MRMEHSSETDQVVLWTMGQAHVDDLIGQLADRYGVTVVAEPYRTALRETFVRRCSVQGRHVKQSGGHGQYAVCSIEIEPLPRGAGFEFVDKVVGGAVPRQFIPSVEKGARLQLEKGLLTGHPVVDVRVTLTDGKAHSVDSSDVAFQTAAALALKEAANASTMALLEPIDRVDITIADEYLGAVMSDLRGRRGQVLGTEPADGMGPDGGVDRRARRGALGGAVALPHRPAVGVARHRVVRARTPAPRPAARRQGQGPAGHLIERAIRPHAIERAIRPQGARTDRSFDQEGADGSLFRSVRGGRASCRRSRRAGRRGRRRRRGRSRR